ncbi:MAG: hypothetical protein JW891_09405 [Candidatus Lokiarchaeota archaeon]|nr:hypothetical protein [Candidatus Lokiarchaeota archaeon]
MTEIKLTISDTLLEKMKKHPEINFELIAQAALEEYIRKIEISDSIVPESKLTLDDVSEISDEITKQSWQEHKKYLNL